MLFNRDNKNSINKFKWKFEYEDTVYKVYDWNNNLAAYFFPNYNSIQKQNRTKNGRNEKQQEEEGEVIEEMNKLHENVRGGSLMIPMLRLNLLDNEEENERMNLNYTIDALEENLHRAKQWEQWLEQNAIEFEVSGNSVYTAREDRNMLSLVIGIDSDIILGEKEIGLVLIPLLDKLHEDGML
jgi:molybdopterin converting factor small subunit